MKDGKKAPQSFTTLHPKVVGQFSTILQEHFPLALRDSEDSDRGAGGTMFTKLLVTHIRACLTKRLALVAIAGTLCKAYQERFFDARLLWAQYQLGKRGAGGDQSGSQTTLTAFFQGSVALEPCLLGPTGMSTAGMGSLYLQRPRDNIQVCAQHFSTYPSSLPQNCADELKACRGR